MKVTGAWYWLAPGTPAMGDGQVVGTQGST
jgi:hypothetical protein